MQISAEKNVRHLLMQASGKMAECQRFIFLLFDQMQRHEASRFVGVTVKSNHASMQTFADLLIDPLFAKKQNAKLNPTDARSKALLN